MHTIDTKKTWSEFPFSICDYDMCMRSLDCWHSLVYTVMGYTTVMGRRRHASNISACHREFSPGEHKEVSKTPPIAIIYTSSTTNVQ